MLWWWWCGFVLAEERLFESSILSIYYKIISTAKSLRGLGKVVNEKTVKKKIASPYFENQGTDLIKLISRSPQEQGGIGKELILS